LGYKPHDLTGRICFIDNPLAFIAVIKFLNHGIEKNRTCPPQVLGEIRLKQAGLSPIQMRSNLGLRHPEAGGALAVEEKVPCRNYIGFLEERGGLGPEEPAQVEERQRVRVT
jgi:hypothetical protein